MRSTDLLLLHSTLQLVPQESWFKKSLLSHINNVFRSSNLVLWCCARFIKKTYNKKPRKSTDCNAVIVSDFTNPDAYLLKLFLLERFYVIRRLSNACLLKKSPSGQLFCNRCLQLLWSTIIFRRQCWLSASRLRTRILTKLLWRTIIKYVLFNLKKGFPILDKALYH